MQIGLRIGPQNVFSPMPEYLAFVRRAEALGFDPLLFSDTVSLSHFHVRDPFVVMALAAGVTERAGLGTGVTTPFTRHPSVVANAFGSIDDAIAPRRTYLGIGSGDTAAYLIGKRAARLVEMREHLKVLRALLDGEPVTFQGATLHSNWRKPHLPIYLAADDRQRRPRPCRGPRGVALAPVHPRQPQVSDGGPRRAGRASAGGPALPRALRRDRRRRQDRPLRDRRHHRGRGGASRPSMPRASRP